MTVQYCTLGCTITGYCTLGTSQQLVLYATAMHATPLSVVLNETVRPHRFVWQLYILMVPGLLTS